MAVKIPMREAWELRLASYRGTLDFPVSMGVGEDGRLFGVWVMGNAYGIKSGYYGGYPPTYLKRVRALFPEKQKPLHLFSGRIDASDFPGDSVDLNADLTPTYVDDAQTLAKVPVESYDIVLADPPYSVEDAEHYQGSMIKRNRVMHVLGERLQPGAHVVWLDQVYPIWTKKAFDLVGAIGMVKSTNHRFRVVTIYRRENND